MRGKGLESDESLDQATRGLIERLDLDQRELASVQAAADNPEVARRELLAYYRKRRSVKHPLTRRKRQALRRKPLPKGTREIADDALKNTLVTCPHYPRHDFGRDIDWYTNHAPNGDNEWIWQLQRHASLDALGRAYCHTGNERYARGYTRLLLDWIRKCPLSHADGQSGSPTWRRIEAGIRGYRWMIQFQQFLDSPSYTPEVLVAFLNSCHEHATYLTRVFSKRNWGLMEAEGLASIAVIFPEFKEATAWRTRAFKHLAEQIGIQVRPDGHQVEQCINYHAGCIRWFSRTAELAMLNGLDDCFSPAFWKRLRAMCDVLLKLGLPDGSSTQFGDTHTPVSWRLSLKEWADSFERKDWLYVGTEGKRGVCPKQTAFALKDSGFYSMRSGWDQNDLCMILRCGPGGFWHCQPDNGTFEIYAGGRRLLPDSGTYIYSGDTRARKWFRQTRVHQTLTLAGQDALQKARCRLWKPGKSLDTLVVENDSYSGLKHRRAVLFVKKKFFVIVDEALGRAEGPVWLHFQLAPGPAAFDIKNVAARTDFSEGSNILIQGMLQPGMKMTKEKGLVSFAYGEKEPRPAFRFALNKTRASCRFVTVLVPYEEDVPVVQGVSVLPARPGSSKIDVDVEVDGVREHVAYDLAPK